jgi:hypothetical protein
MTESRKILYDDEAYPIINAHTRSAFLLSDGGGDASKSLQFSNVRDDVLLNYARLIFRYRLNLDDLFPSSHESVVFEANLVKLREDKSELNMRVEDFTGLVDKNELATNSQPISKPLTKINSSFTSTALQMSEMLFKMYITFQTSKDLEVQYVSFFITKHLIRKQ